MFKLILITGFLYDKYKIYTSKVRSTRLVLINMQIPRRDITLCTSNLHSFNNLCDGSKAKYKLYYYFLNFCINHIYRIHFQICETRKLVVGVHT